MGGFVSMGAGARIIPRSSCGSENLLLVDLGLADPQRPYHPVRPPELPQELGVVLLEVLVEDDVDPGIIRVLRHLYGPPGEDRDLGDVFRLDHGVQDARADEARRAGKDEVHLRDWAEERKARRDCYLSFMVREEQTRRFACSRKVLSCTGLSGAGSLAKFIVRLTTP